MSANSRQSLPSEECRRPGDDSTDEHGLRVEKPLPRAKRYCSLAPSNAKSLRLFTLHNWKAPAAMFAGLVCVSAAYGFTSWLSRQHFTCPSWALHCQVNRIAKGIGSHLGLVQGIVTTVFNVGLSLMAYKAYTLSEAAVWPILQLQPYTINELDSYIQASRGSLGSLPQMYRSTRSFGATFVILCLTVAMIVPLSGFTVVGYAYTRIKIPVDYKSAYRPGGGVSFKFKQTNPPRPQPGSIGDALNLYTSWSGGLSSEPLPELRHFILARANLSVIGNFSVGAIRSHVAVNCSGHAVEVLNSQNNHFQVNAYCDQHGRENLTIRAQPFLTTWVDDVENDFVSPRSVVTLIFAALNGTIEGGQHTPYVFPWKNETSSNGISAVACRVAVELTDDVARIGSGGENAVSLTSLETINALRDHKNKDLSAAATWIGVAPSFMSFNTGGEQPMFSKIRPAGNSLPRGFTSWYDKSTLYWSLDELKHFIDVSAGAVAMGTGQNWLGDEVEEIASRQLSSKLDEKRPPWLLAPPAVMLCIILLLATWNAWAHRRLDLPSMKLANMGEFILSSRTAYITDAVARSGTPSTLGLTRVQYGFDAEQSTHGFVNPSFESPLPPLGAQAPPLLPVPPPPPQPASRESNPASTAAAAPTTATNTGINIGTATRLHTETGVSSTVTATGTTATAGAATQSIDATTSLATTGTSK